MGNFKIVIEAIGSHGVDRGKKAGDVINFYADGSSTPDALAKSVVERLKWDGFNVTSATITHWPGSDGEVQDDLITGVRNNDL